MNNFLFRAIPAGQRVYKMRLCNATLLAKLWMRLNFNRTLWYTMCVPLKAECAIKRRILDYWESVALCVVYPRGGQGSSNFQNHKQKYVFNKRIIKVCVSCLFLTLFLFTCSSTSNARGKLRALEGRCASSKSPSRVRDRDEGVAGRSRR